ncbi:MAG TPA: TetR/AcrR family transcriptional regulator [Acidimicrobiales bacterium]|nr:TetR/AcrR family transcriptional regulator [Acidimicrobiales bacterium]
MPGPRTRDALLEQGALLFARHGVARVTARQLHEAVGARNESALHYHFGNIDGLVAEIVRHHVAEVEVRRAPLVDAIVDAGLTDDLRALVRALAVPMSEDLDTPIGRAHLRIVAQVSHPALAYEMPFRVSEAPAGTAVVRWLWHALDALPDAIRTERLALLRAQLISGFGLRAQLLDDQPSADEPAPVPTPLFVENLVDVIVAGLRVDPSAEALAVTPRRRRTAHP